MPARIGIESGSRRRVLSAALFAALACLAPRREAAAAAAAPPLTLGDHRQLFVDRSLIDRLDHAELRLNHPERREVVFRFDAPWEGPMSAYVTVMDDDGQYRLYYRGGGETTEEVTAMALSRDGITWTRPELGLYAFRGGTNNNIVYRGRRKAYWESHNFTPFKDRNPAARAAQNYKAIALGRHVRPDGEDVKALVALASPDGIHWQRMQEAAIITTGSFDSQNVAFWDTQRHEYVCYLRDGRPNAAGQRIRSVMRTASQDLISKTRTCSHSDSATDEVVGWAGRPAEGTPRLATPASLPRGSSPPGSG